MYGDSHMKPFKMFVLASFLFALTYGLKCPDGFYYDCTTNSCENCSNICSKGNTQEMEGKCWRLCRNSRKESKTSAKSTVSETVTASKTTDSVAEDMALNNTTSIDKKAITDSLLAIQRRRLKDVLVIFSGIIAWVAIGYLILKYCCYQNNQNNKDCKGSCNLIEIIIQKKLQAPTQESFPLTAV